MTKWKRFIAVIAFGILATLTTTLISSKEVLANDKIAYGSDVGLLSQLENEGITWVDDTGEQEDALKLLKEKGVDAIRIRAFVKPNSNFKWTKPDGSMCMLGYSDTKGVIYTAKRAKELGMKVMIVFHYSDHFADPMYQDIPSEWQDASASELEKYVYDYTYYVMSQLAEENIYPEWVQVGNELTSGMLLPYGSSTSNFSQLAKYLNSGYDAVKVVSPSTKVVTHLAHGHDIEGYKWFLDQFIKTYSGKTDVIGMSYYPLWIGSNEIEKMTENLNSIVRNYGKEVMVCETGGYEKEEKETYDLLREEINALNAVPGNKGIGIFYWEPEVNSDILLDKYPLGATKIISDKKLQFTTALNAFQKQPEFLSSETSFEIKNQNSDKALNVTGGSTDNEASVEQYGYAKWDSQKWVFEKVDNGYYKIVNKKSGKVLEVNGMSTLTGAKCQQYEDNGGWNQQWKVIETSDYKYLIQNRLSELYLGISNSSIDDGAACVQLDNSNSDNVKWEFLVTE